MRGQISTELIIIIGLVLLLFIPILITIYIKAMEANEHLASYQSAIAQSRLVNTADAVGHLGQGAYIITEVYLPPDVQKIEFAPRGSGGEIIFEVRSGNATSALAGVVKFPLAYAGDPIVKPSAGVYRFRIHNTGNQVAIERIG